MPNKVMAASNSYESPISPLSLQDGITDSFAELLKESDCESEFDYLSLAIHGLMNEAGFNIQFDQLKHESSPSRKLPLNWKKNGDMFRFDYVYDCHQEGKCSVTALVIGNSLLITGTVNMDECDDAYNVKLKTSEYIEKSELKSDENKHLVYKNWCKLSHKIRDNVTLKMLNEIKSKLGICEEVLGLTTLPQELKLRLICLLDVVSVSRLSQVSKDMHALCEDIEVWKRLVYREFKGSNPVGATYKEVFKYMFLLRKRERELLKRDREIPNTPFRPDFDLGPDLIYTPRLESNIPGMIGGFSDLHPCGFPRHPLRGPGAMNPPDILLDRNSQRNRILRPPGARFDPIGPHQEDELDPFSRRPHPDTIHKPGFGPGGGFGGFGPGGGFGGGFGGFL